MTTTARGCMGDAGIVRNRAKIDATIGNAAGVLALADEFGSFDAYFASMVPGPPARLPAGTAAGEIPASTPASDALSKDLRRRGFRFVGTTIVYAFMQSVGLVDDHLPGCFRYGATTLAVTTRGETPAHRTPSKTESRTR